MSTRDMQPGARRLQAGSATIEYAVIALVVALVLLGVDENVVTMVMDAIRGMYRAFTSALSLTFPAP